MATSQLRHPYAKQHRVDPLHRDLTIACTVTGAVLLACLVVLAAVTT